MYLNADKRIFQLFLKEMVVHSQWSILRHSYLPADCHNLVSVGIWKLQYEKKFFVKKNSKMAIVILLWERNGSMEGAMHISSSLFQIIQRNLTMTTVNTGTWTLGPSNNNTVFRKHQPPIPLVLIWWLSLPIESSRLHGRQSSRLVTKRLWIKQPAFHFGSISLRTSSQLVTTSVPQFPHR